MFVVQRHQDTSQTFCQICVDLVFGVHEHDNILHKHLFFIFLFTRIIRRNH